MMYSNSHYKDLSRPQSRMVETASSSVLKFDYFEELLDYIYHECKHFINDLVLTNSFRTSVINIYITDIIVTSKSAFPLYLLANYFVVSTLSKAVDDTPMFPTISAKQSQSLVNKVQCRTLTTFPIDALSILSNYELHL